MTTITILKNNNKVIAVRSLSFLSSFALKNLNLANDALILSLSYFSRPSIINSSLPVSFPDTITSPQLADMCVLLSSICL